jgi:hypothetical protein
MTRLLGNNLLFIHRHNTKVSSLDDKKTSAADPDPGSKIRDWVPFWPLDPGSGMSRKSASGSGMNNPDHIFKSLETIFFGLKY